jgi:hypothetical protein
MAELDGKLYVALQGGFLVRCDLRGSPCEVLASNRRKQHLSPFDDGPLFSVPYMAADSKRHRLLCFINIPSLADYMGDRRWTNNGLWQYDPAKGSFQQILRVSGYNGGGIAGGSGIQNDDILLWRPFLALRVDLRTDKAKMIFADWSDYELLPGLSTGTSPYKKVPTSWGAYVEADGWLWSAWDPFSRFSKDGTVEILPALETGRFAAQRYQYLKTTADNSRLIVGDHSAMWLLTLKDALKP